MNQLHNKQYKTKTKQRVKKEINLQLDKSRTQIPHDNRRPLKHYTEERLCVCGVPSQGEWNKIPKSQNQTNKRSCSFFLRQYHWRRMCGNLVQKKATKAHAIDIRSRDSKRRSSTAMKRGQTEREAAEEKLRFGATPEEKRRTGERLCENSGVGNDDRCFSRFRRPAIYPAGCRTKGGKIRKFIRTTLSYSLT